MCTRSLKTVFDNTLQNNFWQLTQAQMCQTKQTFIFGKEGKKYSIKFLLISKKKKSVLQNVLHTKRKLKRCIWKYQPRFSEINDLARPRASEISKHKTLHKPIHDVTQSKLLLDGKSQCYPARNRPSATEYPRTQTSMKKDLDLLAKW